MWTCTYMAQNGHLPILKFLYINGYTIFSFFSYDFHNQNGINTIYEILYDVAFKKGNIDIMNWLKEIEYNMDNTLDDYENEMNDVD